MTLLSVLLVTFSVAWLGLCALLTRLACPPPVGDEIIQVPTEDGWVLQLHRFRPRGEAPAKTTPLILAHGLNMNRTCWALSPDTGLLSALQQAGYDVFTAEYRGTSGSRPPSAGKRWSYGPEDHYQQDIPALIDKVKQVSGSNQVDWVGHSMGGILLYLYVRTYGSASVRRAVTLGSPAKFGLPRLLSSRATLWVGRVVSGRKRLLGSFLSWLTVPCIARSPGLFATTFLRASHFTRREAISLCTHAFEDVSGRVHSFFIQLAARRAQLMPPSEASVEGYLQGGFERFESPLLVVAGTKDYLAPPRAVVLAWEQAIASHRAFVCFGSTESPEGSPSFGHCDLASSAAAREHVLPLIEAWLSEGPPLAPPEARLEEPLQEGDSQATS